MDKRKKKERERKKKRSHMCDFNIKMGIKSIYIRVMFIKTKQNQNAKHSDIKTSLKKECHKNGVMLVIFIVYCIDPTSVIKI